MKPTSRLAVLFVCVKNGGKSQMAAGLMRKLSSGSVHVEPIPGPVFERWETDEPSDRGIGGIERMRLVRDDIARRVTDLMARI
jgi:arsenate-mycothiol transferase